MGVSSDMRSSRVRRQAAKKPNKERTVQVRFSDEELAALDAICSEKKMTRSAFLRSCVEKVQGGDVEPTYVVTRNADAERMASEAKCIGVNVNQIARALNAETKSHPGSLSPGVLGEGKKRTRNIREKTDRIAAQMGDMGTREDFIRFCSAMRRQSQGTRLNEGYELRVSWSPEELSKDSPEDIQRACEYGYALCKEVAPNAPCWVTVHTDGEGGCVHVHATIANHDLVSGTAIAHGTDHATVKRKNDRLSREMGFTVVGPEPAREPTTWAERKAQFGIESFERVLGNRVADARDHAGDMEEFHASKEALDTLQHPCPGLLAGMHVFAKAGRDAKDPVSRMMADMTAMMLRMMIQQALAEERRRQREEAERRAPVRTPRSADKDTQFDE